MQAKIHLHVAMQINFRHAWIDDTIHEEVEKLGETGSGTRRLHSFQRSLPRAGKLGEVFSWLVACSRRSDERRIARVESREK